MGPFGHTYPIELGIFGFFRRLEEAPHFIPLVFNGLSNRKSQHQDQCEGDSGIWRRISFSLSKSPKISIWDQSKSDWGAVMAIVF